MSKDLEHIYQDGYLAFTPDEDESQNPHENPSLEHEWWSDGWADAEEDLEQL